jgi:hypothetical protein
MEMAKGVVVFNATFNTISVSLEKTPVYLTPIISTQNHTTAGQNTINGPHNYWPI